MEKTNAYWQHISDIAEGKQTLRIAVNDSTISHNSPIQLTVDIPVSGYVNVLGVDASDSLVLLYPNSFSPANQVASGELSLPGNLPFQWTAQPPWGENRVVALVSEEPVNLFKSSLQKDVAGNNTSDFVLPDLADLRLLQSTSKFAGIVDFSTCQDEGGC